MRYRAIRTTVITEKYEECYGIMIVDDETTKSYICDITDSQKEIIEITEILNKNCINECHMSSVIEDYRYQKSKKL